MPPTSRALIALGFAAALLLAGTGDAAAAVRKRPRKRAAPVLTTAPGGKVPIHPLGPHVRNRGRKQAAAEVTLASTTAPAAPAKAAPRVSAAGKVAFVTQHRVYLDRGGADGLGPRDAVLLLRNGRPVGRCAIDMLAAHTATCKSGRARIGDVFRMARAAAPAAGPAAKPLPAPAPDDALEARAEAIAAAPLDKVDYHGPSTATLPPSIIIGAGVTAWSSYPAATGAYAAEEIDVQLHKLQLGDTDLRLDAALTAVRWETFLLKARFRPDTPTQIYVWEAEVSRRELDDRTVFAVGRLWPWHVPGVPMLDGVQVGRRNESGTTEWGAYGGILPVDVSLVPTFDTWAGGVYSAFLGTGRPGDLLNIMRGEARLGLRESATIGLVEEAEAIGELALHALAVDGGARVRYASEVDHGLALERAFLDLRLPASPSGGGWLQVRYTGVSPEQQPLLTAELPSIRGGYHAMLDLYSSFHRTLRFGVFGSFHTDRDSGQNEGEGGLELAAPRLLGDYGGAAVGGSIGGGWLESQAGYVQLLAQPLPRIRVRGRVSGTHTVLTTSDPMTDLFEVGADLQVDATLTQRLRVRVRELARFPVIIQGQLPTGQLPGVMSSVDLIVAL